MSHFEVVWDGSRAKNGGYLFATVEPPPQERTPTPLPSDSRARQTISVILGCLSDDWQSAADLVKRTKGSYHHTTIYRAMATLVASGLAEAQWAQNVGGRWQPARFRLKGAQ